MLSLIDLSNDPVLRELAEQRRRAEKVEKVAADRRSGASGVALIEEAASADFARSEARRQARRTSADDVDVDMSDLDIDLVGHAGFADEHRRRLTTAIEDGMAAGFGDVLARMDAETRAEILARDDVDPAVKRRFGDLERVRGELRQPGYRPPPRKPADPDKPPAGLTGTALIEWAANRDLARLLAPKRTRRR